MAMGEMMGVTPTYEVNKGDDGGFGGNWIWIILFILLLGGNGNGLFGGGNSATRQDISNDFMYSNLNSSLGRIQDQNTFTANAIQQGLCNLGYENLSNFKDLSSQISSCCCETNRNIDAIRYEAAQNTCAITNAIHADGEATRALINANTMQELRDQLQSSQFQLSQQAQSANLIAALRPTPIPAYITCSPYQNGTC